MMKKEEILATEEKVIAEVVESMFNSDEIKHYQDLCSGIETDIEEIETSYLSIAIKIHNIYKKKLYQIDNFPNIYEMAYDKFRLGRTTCSNYIGICNQFGSFDEVTGECTGLLPQYKDYSSSKLAELLRMPKEIRELVNPKMSVREIRRKKQIYAERNRLSEQTDTSGGNTDGAAPEKSAKKKKLELLTTTDIDEVMSAEKSPLLEKLGAFENEHPDTKYTITVTLVYDK